MLHHHPHVVDRAFKPAYDQVRWRYMTRFDRPREFIRDRVVQLKNERVEILRPIMKNLGML